MSIRLALAAASAIAFASPALAQDTTQTPPPAAEQQQLTPEQAAFAAQDEAFRGRMESLITEIRTVLADATTNGAQKTQTVDALITTYQPDIDGFANALTAFLTSQQAVSTDPAEQAAIAQALAEAPAAVRSIPDQIRTSVAAAITQAAAAAEAGVAPTPPPAAAGGAVAGSPPQGAVAGTPPQQ